MRSFLLTVLAVVIAGCGPGRTGATATDVKPRPLTTAEKLIGEWSIVREGASQGSLALFPDGTFLLMQVSPTEPGVFITLAGSYWVDGERVTRTIERLEEVTGADAARAKQIEKAVQASIGSELINTVVWKSDDEFEFSDGADERSTFRRRGT